MVFLAWTQLPLENLRRWRQSMLYARQLIPWNVMWHNNTEILMEFLVMMITWLWEDTDENGRSMHFKKWDSNCLLQEDNISELLMHLVSSAKKYSEEDGRSFTTIIGPRMLPWEIIVDDDTKKLPLPKITSYTKLIQEFIMGNTIKGLFSPEIWHL